MAQQKNFNGTATINGIGEMEFHIFNGGDVLVTLKHNEKTFTATYPQESMSYFDNKNGVRKPLTGAQFIVQSLRDLAVMSTLWNKHEVDTLITALKVFFNATEYQAFEEIAKFPEYIVAVDM